MMRFGCTFLFFLSSVLAFAVPAVVWPTDDKSFFHGLPYTEFIQPTASGNPESGLYGYVRNSGNRFHEGIDIKAAQKDKRGEATDSIYSVMEGKIVHISYKAGHSSYGRYIVIKHESLDLPVYTLYSHLANIDPDIKISTHVHAGTRIGTMGRSAAGYTIPKQRAHLHFEIGLMLTDRFQVWYDRQKFDQRNRHSIWNGMNLAGVDPLRFFAHVHKGQFNGMADYWLRQPIAFELEVYTRQKPDFLERYPILLDEKVNMKQLYGWRIGLTAEGLPIRWRPIHKNELGPKKAVIKVAALHDTAIRPKVIRPKGSKYVIGSDLRRRLDLIFLP